MFSRVQKPRMPVAQGLGHSRVIAATTIADRCRQSDATPTPPLRRSLLKRFFVRWSPHIPGVIYTRRNFDGPMTTCDYKAVELPENGSCGGYIRPGWNVNQLCRGRRLTNRRIAHYARLGWYSAEFRQARRELAERKQTMREGNFVHTEGRLIFSP